MAENGDERQAAAWERVEAKLDRLFERVDEHGDVLHEHGKLLKLIDRRLSRVEGDLELVKLLIEGVRHEVDRKTEKLKDELLTELGRETRVELLAAQSLTNGRLASLEGRVSALETAKA